MRQLQPTQKPDPQQIMQLAGGYVFSAVLNAIVQADVADHLECGPRPVSELAKATGTNEDALFRMLRLLVTVGVFEETGSRIFGLTPSGHLLRNNHPMSMRDMTAFFCDPFHMRIYADLDESLRSGRPAAEKTFGMPVFEYFAKNPEYSAIFNRAMTNLSASIIPAVIEAYDFSGIDTLVDVGGGHAQVLISILKAYPSMRGILVDLGHVIEGAKTRITESGLTGRLQTVPGDFFQSIPATGDAYIMKHIIHDWNDERATVILRNIRTAIGDAPAKLLLLEGVVESGSVPDMRKILDIEMLAIPGG